MPVVQVPLTHRLARWTLMFLAAGLAVQFYTAGLGLIAGRSMAMHSIGGWLMLLLALVNLVATVFSRARRGGWGFATGIIAIVALQPVLVLAVRPHAPAVAALHAFNGLIALGLAGQLIRRWASPPER